LLLASWGGAVPTVADFLEKRVRLREIAHTISRVALCRPRVAAAWVKVAAGVAGAEGAQS